MDDQLFQTASTPMNLAPVTNGIQTGIHALLILSAIIVLGMAACRYYQIKIAR